jgi:protein subunit release factor A
MPDFVTTSQPGRHRGGQHVGTGPSVIRVEVRDEDGFVICAAEVHDGYHGRGQHRARELAVTMIELALQDYRHQPHETAKGTEQ